MYPMFNVYINYFTHLIHCTAVKQIITMIFCVFMYSVTFHLLMTGVNSVNLSHESLRSSFPYTESCTVSPPLLLAGYLFT
jgi:hypothetical protein